MGKSRKPTPEKSSISRARPLAYARRQKASAEPEPSAPEPAPARAANVASETSPPAPLRAVLDGTPPREKPAAAVAPRAVSVEDPAHMPAPREIPDGDPADVAPPPGRVPSGDSRSLRRGDEFALVYRVHGAVICRSGTVGRRGQWRVVEYPTSALAGNAFAREVSRFVGEGFVDYRD